MTRLVVRLTPKAASDRIDGWDTDEQGRAFLKVRIAAPPIEGRANEALIAYLAKRLKVPKSRLTLLAGDTSRLKQIEVEGLDEAEVRALL
ncbi:DUF167 domain-containing protein [Asticcacaulis sp. YBE204]|uniref:DUF167 domain-containing protein n=1 Tax=Asticcacaulis sp. YBE204 TaxID=1282363 RepID=UPI0003C3CB4A|nr:DUF167 domain-containing protein [Asticcacaulis sp. YBE204]ESQ77901.1 hypothetical protein AEYBE204_16630 [Asticcacaulis sp. YBE204]